jgi:hypothetical protein
MFQLFDLIMTSPLGVFLVSAIENVIYAALVVSDCDECGFDDLGKLLIGGVILAVAVGIGLSVLIRKMKEKDPATSDFVSIRATRRND